MSLSEPGFDHKIIYYDSPPYDYYVDIDRKDAVIFGLGVEGTVGLEWFWGRNFSLLFEYGFTLQNEWLLYETDVIYGYDDGVNDWEAVDEGLNFDADYVKMGLSVYF